MKPYRSILAVVPADACHSPAVDRALRLARASGATLHLCLFDHDPVVDLAAGSAAEPARRDILRQRAAQLQRLTAGLPAAGCTVRSEAVWAPRAADAILAKALELGADLVVKDARREAPLRRAVLTPLDWRLMRLLPCALLLAGPRREHACTRVAAAVDVLAEPVGADGLNRQVVDAGLLLAEYLNARLDLVSVLPFERALRYAVRRSSQAAFAEAEAAHLDAFNCFAQLHGVPADRRHRLAGPPDAELARFVTEALIDVLVLGAQYHSRWERFLLGSTAEALAQEAGSDVLPGPVNTTLIAALPPKIVPGKARGAQFGEPNERRATQPGAILGATRRDGAIFAHRRVDRHSHGMTMLRASLLALGKNDLRRSDQSSVNRP